MLSQVVRRAFIPSTYKGLSTGLMFRFSEDKEDNNNSEGTS